MGNYKFKLSDMMPNAWFYKLRDMGKTRKQIPTTQSMKKKQSSPSSSITQPSKPKQPHQFNPRKSYYFTRELNLNNPNNQTFSNTKILEPPRKSSKQRSKRRTSRTYNNSPKFVTPSSTHESSSSPLDSSAESEFPEPEFRTDRVLPTESFDEMVSWSNTNDIIIDVDNNSITRKHYNVGPEEPKLERRKLQTDKLLRTGTTIGYDSFSELVLPPIVTKPEKFNDLLSDAKKKETKPRSRIATHEENNIKGSLKVRIVKEDCAAATMKEQRSSPSRRVRLRIHSPRIGSRKIQAHGRKSVSAAGSGSRRSLSDSFAIVKSSFNPQRDFRESMVEMIVQNNIRTSKDLEDLLACYLSLNADEYHGLIIKVFKQIWFDLTDNQ